MPITNLKNNVVLIAGEGKNLGALLPKDFAGKGVKLDLTKVENGTKFFYETIVKFGGIDMAINTVGTVLKKRFTDTTEAEYDKMFGVKSKAAYFFLQEAGKKINDNGKICTIVTSQLAGFTGPVRYICRSKSTG